MVGAQGAMEDSGWVLVRRDRAGEVWNRPVPGSGLDAFRAVGMDTVDMDRVESILRDLPGFARWVPYLAESRMLREETRDHFFVYQRYALPWPFSDRDIVVEIHVSRDSAAGVVRSDMRAVDDPSVAVPGGVVRLLDMEGVIELQRLGPALTRGSYTERLDLGGAVPTSINRIIAREIPARILENLRRESRRRNP